MTRRSIISWAANVFGKPRLAKTLATKKINLKFFLVNAVNYLCFLFRLDASFAPSYIVMEPSGICNLKCPFCFLTIEGVNRNMIYMSPEFFRDFISRNRRYLSHIHFGMWGEPLLNKDLPAMIEIASKAGIRTILITNGSVLTDEKMIALGKAGLTAIDFSVDGLEKDYERIRQVKWSKLLSKIEIAKRHRHLGYKIEVNGVEYNFWDKDEYLRFFEELGVDHVFTQPLYYEEKNKAAFFAKPCYRPWHTLAIYADGDVSICCFDHKKGHVVGNANAQTLKQIFRSERQKEIRRAFKTGIGIPNLCQGCNPIYR